MASFYCNNNASLAVLTSTAKTQIALITTASTTAKSRVFELMFGPASTPNSTDCEVVYDFLIKDATAAGTAGVALATQVASDQSGLVSINKYATNYSAEPTVYSATNGGIAVGLNQRASFRWVATPGNEICLPPTLNQGGGLRAKSSNNVGNVVCSLGWME